MHIKCALRARTIQGVYLSVSANRGVSSPLRTLPDSESTQIVSYFPLISTANEVMCDEEDNHISYHADKNDCTMYYMCEGERKHHMPCPVNLVFNPNENVCDWPENVEGCLQHTQAPPV